MTMAMIDGENNEDNIQDDDGWNKIVVLALNFREPLAESEHERLTINDDEERQRSRKIDKEYW